ncbi:MAG TPA: TonB-dependent receptor, partial [Sphingomicrobium sp.]|nr:TonB-dependent receptor [Sphingomicrobium sp.]
TLRWGFDFFRPLKSARPSQATIDQLRQQMRRRMGDRPAGASRAPDARDGPPVDAVIVREGPPPEGRGERGGFGEPGGGGPGGGFGGGRFFGGGGRQGGRLQFSLTHTVNLVDEVVIRPGVPELDYLHGDAFGSSGGRPRHEVEAQVGWSNNGLGARLSADWRSATRVDSAQGGSLRFAPLATFDLRLFANLGERLDLVAKRPWLRGTQVRFEVRNLFDSKPRVRDAAGEVPLSHQPDLLDPLGRTVGISVRKLFLPPPSFFRRQRPPGPAS